jgi:hypothetical protein
MRAEISRFPDLGGARTDDSDGKEKTWVLKTKLIFLMCILLLAAKVALSTPIFTPRVVLREQNHIM